MTDDYKIVFLGTSKLLYKCAEYAKERYAKAVIQIIDFSESRWTSENVNGDLNIRFLTKQDAFNYLFNLSGKTYVFSVNNPYIFPKEICEKSNLIMINLHHGLLPKHRGRNAEAWAIYDGDEYAGITWHFISPQIDKGEIICQRKVKIDSDSTTSFSLLRLCEKAAIESFEEIFPLENLKRKVNDGDCVNEQIRYAKDRPNNGLLDLTWDISKISSFLRAMDYGPYRVLGNAEVVVLGRKHIIKKYSIAILNENIAPTISLNDKKIIVGYNNLKISIVID